MNHNRPATIFLPRLPDFSSEYRYLHKRAQNYRDELVTQLERAGMRVDNINGTYTSLDNMMKSVAEADAYLFPPLSKTHTHPGAKQEAANRWFEFFSLSTAAHIGGMEIYDEGISKPCLVIDQNRMWDDNAISLLRYLKDMGMLSSNIDEIVRVAPPVPKEERADYVKMISNGVETLKSMFQNRVGKKLAEVHYKYSKDHQFPSFRKPFKRSEFGIMVLGSATTTEDAYLEPSFELGKMIGQRGWRIVTGAGKDGCMGATDRGFEEGRREFNAKFPNAIHKPAHIGVSTNAILRLEGPPDNLDQLIITENIYHRLQVMANGQTVISDKDDPEVRACPSRQAKDECKQKKRASNAVKVAMIEPGGTGTLHEYATLLQLITHEMIGGTKIVLCNFASHKDASKGFWDPIIAVAKNLGFDGMFEVANTPEEAMKIADREYARWVEREPHMPRERDKLYHPTFQPNPPPCYPVSAIAPEKFKPAYGTWATR